MNTISADTVLVEVVAVIAVVIIITQWSRMVLKNEWMGVEQIYMIQPVTTTPAQILHPFNGDNSGGE